MITLRNTHIAQLSMQKAGVKMTDIKEQKRINGIVLVFFLLRFLNCFIPASTAYVLLLVTVEASALLLYTIRYGARCKVKVIVPVFVMIVFEAVSWFVLGDNHLFDLINTLLGLFLGYYLARVKLIKKIAIILLAVFVGIILVRFFVSGSANSIFLRASRNNVSAFIILGSVLLYSTSLRSERVSLFPAIITFVFSCLAEGRGGVVSSFILLAGIVLYNLFSKKKPTIIQILLSIGTVVLFVFLITNYYDFVFSKAITRLYSQSFSENERNNIINLYFTNIKAHPIYLLFGVPSKMIPIVEQLNGNFHNSYLSLHSNFGIFGFAIVIIILIVAIRKGVMNRNWLCLLLLLTICVRMFTDGLCFAGLYDPLFYYIAFMCVLEKKEERETINEHY